MCGTIFLAKREFHRIASLPVPILFPPCLHGEKWSAYLHHQKLIANPCNPVLDSLGVTGFDILGAEGTIVFAIVFFGSMGNITYCYFCIPSHISNVAFQICIGSFCCQSDDVSMEEMGLGFVPHLLTA